MIKALFFKNHPQWSANAKQQPGKPAYQPFDQRIPSSSYTDIGFTGHKHDGELGLTYMQQRYYDPLIGRFYSNDPVDFLGHLQRGNPTHGFNRYTYANNNPYKYTDPDGEFAFVIPLIVPFVGGTTMTVSPLVVASGVAAGAVLTMRGDSADPLSGVLEGATEGEKTKGRTTNWDKSGGMGQADTDFDQLVDPDSVAPITDSKGGEGRRGTMNDGSGRNINVRSNSSDGRPTVEVQDGKDKVKIRYDEEK